MRTGGSTEERRAEMEARMELVKNHLHDNANSPIRFNELSALFDISVYTVRKDCAVIAENDPTIQFVRGAVMYVPPTRYSGVKNEEGYNDPTATAAITSKEERPVPYHESNYMLPRVGDVWDVKCASGNIEKYIVIAVNDDEDYATCIMYYPEEDDMDRSCKKLFSKPIRYFMSKSWGTPLSQLTGYREKIAEYLDIEPAVEEKIVEKVVEVPVAQEAVVECTSDKIYTQADMDKMRADIYKECLYLMAGRKEM